MKINKKSNLLRTNLLKYKDLRPIHYRRTSENYRHLENKRSTSILSDNKHNERQKTNEMGIQLDGLDLNDKASPSPVRTPVYSVDKNSVILSFNQRSSSLRDGLTTELKWDDLSIDKSHQYPEKLTSHISLNSKTSKISTNKPRPSRMKITRFSLDKTPKHTPKILQKSQFSPKLLKRTLFSQTVPIEIFDYKDICNIFNGKIKIIKK